MILRTALTFGLNVSIVSSWKLESSATTQPSSVVSRQQSAKGFPILPTTYEFLK